MRERVQKGEGTFVDYAVNYTKCVHGEGYAWSGALADFLVLLVEVVVKRWAIWSHQLGPMSGIIASLQDGSLQCPP